MGIVACCDANFNFKYAIRSISTLKEENETVNQLFPLTDNRFAVLLSEKIVKVYRITPEKIFCEININFEKKNIPFTSTKVKTLCQTSNGNLMIVQAKYFQIIDIDPKNMKVLACQTQAFELSKVIALPNNRIACSIVNNENILIFNFKTETEIIQAAILKGDKYIYKMITVDDFLFAYREGETIEKWDLNTYQCVNTFQLQSYNLINFVAVNSKILYTSQGGNIVSINTENSKITKENEYDKGNIKEIAVLDEQKIVLISDKGNVVFCDKEKDDFFEVEDNKENKIKDKLITVNKQYFIVCDGTNSYKIWKYQ